MLFWFFSVPVIGWSVWDDFKYLQGKMIGKSFSLQILPFALSMAVMAMFWQKVPQPWPIVLALLCWVSYLDARYRTIPNTVFITFMATGFYLNGLSVLSDTLFTILALLPFIILLRGAIGWGDIKLTVGLGSLMGTFNGINIFWDALIVAFVYIVAVKVKDRKLLAFIQETWFHIKYFFALRQSRPDMPEKLEEMKAITIPLGSFFLVTALIQYFYGSLSLLLLQLLN